MEGNGDGVKKPDVPADKPVHVVILDDYPVAREALPALLAENGIVVSATAASARDAKEILDRHNPAVALVGVTFADQVEEYTRRLAQAPQAPPMLIRTHDRELRGIEADIPEGVQGAISRRTSLEELARAIRTVAAGGTWFETAEERPGRNERRTAQLSKRERRVLIELARGATTDEMAATLHLTTHTVRSHVRNILRKLQARSRAHAVAIACSEGIIDIRV
jgi:DNA-binding NarL/FixJ family response regulator